jgi:hypothetical protein
MPPPPLPDKLNTAITASAAIREDEPSSEASAIAAKTSIQLNNSPVINGTRQDRPPHLTDLCAYDRWFRAANVNGSGTWTLCHARIGSQLPSTANQKSNQAGRTRQYVHVCPPDQSRAAAVYLPHSAGCFCTGIISHDSSPELPPTREDAVAAFRLRDPDLTPSTRQEGEVRITPAPLRKR